LDRYIIKYVTSVYD